jgi:putative endopeptidase
MQLRRYFLAVAALVSLPTLLAAQSQSPAASHGIKLSAMDSAIRPGDDFYLFCNGSWVAHTDIPADRTSITGFSQLAERTDAQITAIIQASGQANAAPSTDQRRMADLYASYMNTAAINAAGSKPLQPAFARIDAIHDQRTLAEALGRTLRADVDALNAGQFHTATLFGLWVAPGFHDPHQYAPYFFQGGLSLPSRDYYLDSSAHMTEVRQQFVTPAATMFRLASLNNPEQRANDVVALETAIAKVQISLADSENIRKADNLWSTADFTAKAPGLDWSTFFAAAQLGSQKEFYVWQPTAVTAEAALVASTPIETWRDFLRLHEIEALAPYLAQPFSDESFHFFGTVLSGAQQQRPRDRRARDLVNTRLGDAVGKIYADRYFPASSKQQAQQLVANLLAVYHQRLEAITWMAPSTKAEALHKLQTLRVSVGYPDRFRTYDGLEIRPDDLAGNIERSRLFEYRFQLSRIGQPRDPGEWSMTPQTVNAVEMPLNNALNFPAAILQPPFFDPAAPAAANYGAIGTVIGHEISHTFDSEGSDFDAEGRVRDWWTAADRAHFEASTAALAAQFDTYEVLPGLHVNGRQTLGEDIADLAGLNAALDAYHVSLKGETAPKIGNFDGDQQFFIAFGQNWQGKAREAAQRQQVLVDPHAPGPIRAETVRNLDAWYTDFHVTPDQKLYLAPDKRVRIF